ncbi:uncharacterized protein [Centruroides vittatus]|uniref:uncharacterized protein n=1 Tax=Centruroides vittatus TaxID=120091 RepID=UPI00350EA8EB
MKFTQEKYAKDLLKKFNMQACRPVATSIESNQKLTKEMAPQSENETNEMNGKPYRELIGGLLYLANSTRPDLAFAASVLSCFCSNPGIVHWKMAKSLLRYIQATVNYGLNYEECDQKLCAHVDSDWAGDIDGRKSSSGNMIILANKPISWESRKQKSVAVSTMKAEPYRRNQGSHPYEKDAKKNGI